MYHDDCSLWEERFLSAGGKVNSECSWLIKVLSWERVFLQKVGCVIHT